MEINYIEEYEKNLKLAAELSQMNELSKTCSRLEQRCIYLELELQHNKESFPNDKPSENRDAPKFHKFFIINELKAHLQAKDTTISNLKKHIQKLKGKSVADCSESVSKSKVIAPVVHKLDKEPLSVKLKNNMEAHVDYIRIFKENVDTLRDIVEQARILNPLDNALAYACMYDKCKVWSISKSQKTVKGGKRATRKRQENQKSTKRSQRIKAEARKVKPAVKSSQHDVSSFLPAISLLTVPAVPMITWDVTGDLLAIEKVEGVCENVQASETVELGKVHTGNENNVKNKVADAANKINASQNMSKNVDIVNKMVSDNNNNVDAKKNKNELDRNLCYTPASVNSVSDEIVIFDEELVMEGCKKWEDTVCGYFAAMSVNKGENEVPFEFKIDEGGSPLGYGEDALKEGMGGGGGDGHDLFDFFQSFFGGGGSPFGGSSSRGEDVVHPLKVSLEDLYNGTSKKLSLSHSVLCSKFKGGGSTSGASMKCVGCQGSRMKVSIRHLGPSMIQQMQHPCNKCKGIGETINDKDRCTQCKGEKVMQEKKGLEVHVEKVQVHTIILLFETNNGCSKKNYQR
ncbi:DnaJ protein [Tanacetum coccineum]